MWRSPARTPWRVYQNCVRDLVSLRFGALDDGVMTFRNPLHPRPAQAGA